ncbi:hypothetical protein Tco_1281118 [Tanacetum coccineum]
MKLLKHLWNVHRGMSFSLKRISLVRDDVMIKILLLLHQIRIKVREDDMMLVLLVHHSHKLPSHQHGRSLTLEVLLQAPPSNNLANALATTYQALAENSLLEKTGDIFLPRRRLTLVLDGRVSQMLTDQIEWANPEGD